MLRDYSIKKYKNNTHYTVYVTDSYGREKVGFFKTQLECCKFVYDFWLKEKPLTEQEKKDKLLSNAIANCIELDKKLGLTPSLD